MLFGIATVVQVSLLEGRVWSMTKGDINLGAGVGSVASSPSPHPAQCERLSLVIKVQILGTQLTQVCPMGESRST